MLSIEPLSFLGATAPEMIETSARVGFDALGLRLRDSSLPDPRAPSPRPALRRVQLAMLRGALDIADSSALASAVRQLRSAGIGLDSVLSVRLQPFTRIDDYRRFLGAAAQLGARVAVVNIVDPDRARVLDRLAALAEAAANEAVLLGIEFTSYDPLGSLETARTMVESVAADNLHIILDVLHHYRSGGTTRQLSAAIGSIGLVQLCDAPAVRQSATAEFEALAERLLPGDGDLPLAEWLAALPEGCPVSLEVSNRELESDHLTGWAAELARCGRQLLSAAAALRL